MKMSIDIYLFKKSKLLFLIFNLNIDNFLQKVVSKPEWPIQQFGFHIKISEVIILEMLKN